MITVILVGLVMSMLAVVITARVIADLDHSLQVRQWDQAINVAEAGIDDTVFRIGEALRVGAPAPSNTTDTAPSSGERAWAIAHAATQSAEDSVRTREGEWNVVIPPPSQRLIYSVGYVPSKESARQIRVLRAEYKFGAYSVDNAVLTDGNLSLSGTVSIVGDDAGVHSNGSITIGGGGPTATYISATGALTATESQLSGVTDSTRTGGGFPRQAVPPITARDYHRFSQYDLCTNGIVRAGPAYTGPESKATAGSPCSGGQINPIPGGLSYTGPPRHQQTIGQPGQCPPSNARMPAPMWTLAATAPARVYYAYGTGLAISGNLGAPGAPWLATLIAEPINDVGGDVQTSGTVVIAPVPALHSTVVAGRDLIIAGTPSSSYTGLFLTHEQFWLSGTMAVNGAFVAEDATDGPFSPVHLDCMTGTASVLFDGGGEYDIEQGVRILHWSEL